MAEKVRYNALVRTLIFIFQDDEVLMMKYSGKGTHQSKEKADRKDIYNPIGGHVEEGEDIIASATKEAMEEAGVHLLDPKIKGVINISGFAGKNMINFIITGRTEDKVLKSTLEGELHWIKTAELSKIHIFDDLPPILEKLTTMEPDQMFTGTAAFEGFKLHAIDLRVI